MFYRHLLLSIGATVATARWQRYSSCTIPEPLIATECPGEYLPAQRGRNVTYELLCSTDLICAMLSHVNGSDVWTPDIATESKAHSITVRLQWDSSGTTAIRCFSSPDEALGEAIAHKTAYAVMWRVTVGLFPMELQDFLHADRSNLIASP